MNIRKNILKVIIHLAVLLGLALNFFRCLMRYETRQGRFSIRAPEEVGFYDFVAIAFPNLFNSTISRFHSPISSFRFTIEVEDQ